MFKNFDTKKKIMLATPIALISIEIFVGVIAGYITGRILSGKQDGQRGIIRSIVLQMGSYRLHFHHWLACTGALAIFFLHSPPIFAHFSYGFLGGVIFHSIFSYSDWYKIITKPRSKNFLQDIR